MNQTLSLYRLQLIDSQIDRIQVQLQNLQKTLDDDVSVRQASELVQLSEKKQHAADLELHQVEAEVQGQRIKIEQTESSLYGGTVHNPKELQDLQNDVAALKRHLADLEDRLLEAMVAAEETENACQAAQVELDTVKAHWAEQNQNITQEQSTRQKELQKLSTEREALVGAITTETLGLYDHLRLQRRGVAVTTINDNACEACGQRLTPAQAQAAHSGGQMAFCPSCGRILYGS